MKVAMPLNVNSVCEKARDFMSCNLHLKDQNLRQTIFAESSQVSIFYLPYNFELMILKNVFNKLLTNVVFENIEDIGLTS
jgi:hypothetical protein